MVYGAPNSNPLIVLVDIFFRIGSMRISSPIVTVSGPVIVSVTGSSSAARADMERAHGRRRDAASNNLIMHVYRDAFYLERCKVYNSPRYS